MSSALADGSCLSQEEVMAKDLRPKRLQAPSKKTRDAIQLSELIGTAQIEPLMASIPSALRQQLLLRIAKLRESEPASRSAQAQLVASIVSSSGMMAAVKQDLKSMLSETVFRKRITLAMGCYHSRIFAISEISRLVEILRSSDGTALLKLLGIGVSRTDLSDFLRLLRQ